MSTEPLTREEALDEFQIMLTHQDAGLHDWERRAITSAITHLSPTPCECDTAKNYVHFALGGVFLGELEDAVKFCPWCGHSVPQPETKAV